jgi:hypothetical protein
MSEKLQPYETEVPDGVTHFHGRCIWFRSSY